MGLRPCTSCHRPYRGKAQHSYPAVLADGMDWRAKQALCPACFTRTRDWAEVHLSFVNYDAPPEEGEMDIYTCPECGDVPEPHATIFVTLFGNGVERRDYYGLCCPSCRPGVEAALGPGLPDPA